MQKYVAQYATILQEKFDVKTGDTVVFYMPMIPEAAFMMLACARIGAPHVIVFGGFAAEELANRIQNCNPKCIITSSAGIEPSRVIPYVPIVDKACEIADCKDLPRLIF
jgi:propionyl-CoA synthetase